MRFDFSDEQLMFAESIRRTLAALPPTSVPPAGTAADVAPPFDRLERTFADLGVFGILVPEAQGGLGLGLVDAVAAAIESGRAATPFPVIEGIAALGMIASARPDVAEAVLAGRAVATAAVQGSLAAAGGGRPTLSGDLVVPFADRARYLVAPVEGDSGDERASLIELDGEAGVATDGLDLSYPLRRLAVDREVSSNELVPARYGRILGILAAAEIVGAADHCLARTVGYLKERQQFGRAIGSYQALKHMAADCKVGLECMKAAVEYAAALHDRDPDGGAEADTAWHTAKGYCSETGLRLAEQCIQLHGGIAFTWEYGLHLHYRRIARLANAYGTAYQHGDRLAGIAMAGAARAGGLAADPD